MKEALRNTGYADIHIDAVLKKIGSPLDMFCSQGWVGRIFNRDKLHKNVQIHIK